MTPHLLDMPLLYGVPIALCAGMHCGFELLLSHRSKPPPKQAAQLSLPPAAQHGLDDDSDRIRVAIAESDEELHAARDLVRGRYEWRGYDVDSSLAPPGNPGDSGTPAQEVTFLARAQELILGTLTLRLDGAEGLLAEGTDEGVIEQVRARGRRVCELTRLAVADNPHSKLVLASLFGITHALALTVHRVTDAFIEVNPRHVRFYSRVLGFVVASRERFCQRVQAPSVLLRLELGERLQLFGIEPSYLQPVFAKAA